MNLKKYKQTRALVSLFVAALVGVSAVNDSYLLAIAGVVVGMLFMILVRSKTKITIDEREKTVREKAAQITYAIFTPTIGVGAFLMIVFARGEFYYLESLGQVFAYLTLYLMTLYAISFYFLNKKYSGDDNEE